MNFSQAIASHPFQVRELLRSYNILQRGSEGIRLGYQRHGAKFLMSLVNIVSIDPDNSSSFTRRIRPRLSNFDTTDEQANNDYLDNLINDQQTEMMNTPSSSGSGSGFWDIFKQALDFAGKTGETIGKFKTDINGKMIPDVSPDKTSPFKGNSLLFVAGGAALLLVIILLFINSRK